jgi:hypothetical protein
MDEVAAAENNLTVEDYRAGLWLLRTGGGNADTTTTDQTTPAKKPATANAA